MFGGITTGSTVTACSWGSPFLPPLRERLCRAPQKPRSVLPATGELRTHSSSRSLHAPGTSTNEIPHRRQVAAPSDRLGFLAGRAEASPYLREGLRDLTGVARKSLGKQPRCPARYRVIGALQFAAALGWVPLSMVSSFAGPNPGDTLNVPAPAEGTGSEAGGLREGGNLGTQSTETGTSIPLPITKLPAAHR